VVVGGGLAVERWKDGWESEKEEQETREFHWEEFNGRAWLAGLCQKELE
jgi:hypothetical protein